MGRREGSLVLTCILWLTWKSSFDQKATLSIVLYCVQSLINSVSITVAACSIELEVNSMEFVYDVWVIHTMAASPTDFHALYPTAFYYELIYAWWVFHTECSREFVLHKYETQWDPTGCNATHNFKWHFTVCVKWDLMGFHQIQIYFISHKL